MNLVNIHEGIDSTLLILPDRLKGKAGEPEIAVVKEYSDLPLVLCYASQLNQVFMNILSNAIDALDNQPPPRIITIKTEKPSAESTLISIADNGPGIPEKFRNICLNPFLRRNQWVKAPDWGCQSHTVSWWKNTRVSCRVFRNLARESNS